MRFVDLDTFELIPILQKYLSIQDFDDICNEIERRIVDVVDTQPVIHAKWIDFENSDTTGNIDSRIYTCSKCGMNVSFSFSGADRPITAHMFGKSIFQYCPYCGVKMDGE